jgi:Xaa-Pro aminopeptidase
MRRGLMAWDAAELPRAALDARMERLRAELRAEGVDAFVAYTNIARGAAVCWLSGFTPYWNEGLFYAPLQGEPIFATALSKRVAEWIGSVMPVGAVTTTPKPPALIGEALARDGARRIGVLELEDFPAGHAQTILATAPGVELVDVTQAFARARGVVDDAERGMLRRAESLVETGLAACDAATNDARALIAACDHAARLGGAEECFTTLAPDLARSGAFLRTDTAVDLGEAFALRVAIAYKGVWTRRTRAFTRDAKLTAAFAAADEALAGFRLDGAIEPALQRHFASLGVVESWSVEQPRGSYPLAVVATPSANAPCVLNVELAIEGRRWLGARLLGL